MITWMWRWNVRYSPSDLTDEFLDRVNGEAVAAAQCEIKCGFESARVCCDLAFAKKIRLHLHLVHPALRFELEDTEDIVAINSVSEIVEFEAG
jgi:hypothetical protein